MSTRRAGGAGRAGGRIGLAVAVAVLLALAVLAAGTAGPAPRDPSRTGSVAPGPEPSDAPLVVGDGPADGYAPLTTPERVHVEVPVQGLFVASLLVVAVLLALLLRSRRHDAAAAPLTADAAAPAGAGPAGWPRPLLERTLAAAQAELSARAPGEPRDAVVAAWLQLEQGAAAAGVPRRPAQTPTEFTTALLTGLLPGDTERAALDELRRLYSRARFGPAPLDADAPERAAAALSALRAGLGSRVAPP